MELENILFLDIETVGGTATYDELDERMKHFWDIKASQIAHSEDDTPEKLYSRAAIYAEFGKIDCISVGYIVQDKVRLTSFADDDEKKLLLAFADLLNKHFNTPKHQLCAHNGKEFDFPYICRRMLIHNIPIPFILNSQGKKPWETTFLDTMELWKFGDYKHYTSLDLLANIFHIPSPKDDINGSQVHETYWKENHNLERIKTYCEKDVLTIVQLMRRFNHLPLIEDENILHIQQ